MGCTSDPALAGLGSALLTLSSRTSSGREACGNSVAVVNAGCPDQ